MNVQSLKEYNEVETYFHATSKRECDEIAHHALEVGKVELIGRPMGDHAEKRSGAQWSEWAGWGQGFVYALDFYSREGCWEYAQVPGSPASEGAMFILGYDGVSEVDPEVENDCEIVVPLSGYEVIAVIVLEDDEEIVYEPMQWAKAR